MLTQGGTKAEAIKAMTSEYEIFNTLNQKKHLSVLPSISRGDLDVIPHSDDDRTSVHSDNIPDQMADDLGKVLKVTQPFKYAAHEGQQDSEGQQQAGEHILFKPKKHELKSRTNVHHYNKKIAPERLETLNQYKSLTAAARKHLPTDLVEKSDNDILESVYQRAKVEYRKYFANKYLFNYLVKSAFYVNSYGLGYHIAHKEIPHENEYLNGVVTGGIVLGVGLAVSSAYNHFIEKHPDNTGDLVFIKDKIDIAEEWAHMKKGKEFDKTHLSDTENIMTQIHDTVTSALHTVMREKAEAQRVQRAQAGNTQARMDLKQQAAVDMEKGQTKVYTSQSRIDKQNMEKDDDSHEGLFISEDKRPAKNKNVNAGRTNSDENPQWRPSKK